MLSRNIIVVCLIPLLRVSMTLLGLVSDQSADPAHLPLLTLFNPVKAVGRKKEVLMLFVEARQVMDGRNGAAKSGARRSQHTARRDRREYWDPYLMISIAITTGTASSRNKGWLVWRHDRGGRLRRITGGCSAVLSIHRFSRFSKLPPRCSICAPLVRRSCDEVESKSLASAKAESDGRGRERVPFYLLDGAEWQNFTERTRHTYGDDAS